MTSARIESTLRRPTLVPPAAIVPLVKALATGPADRLSGALHVAGHPGGVLHLYEGVVTAVDSPGAPDVSTLLLRSGRISEADWAAAVKAGLADGRIGAELISRMLIGAAELQVMCHMAALDAAFAIAVGPIEGCELQHETPRHWLPAQQGIERESLLRETERRLSAFARGSISIAPYQDRLSRGRHVSPRMEDLLSDEHREILVRVNGRRSARDIAFLLGRSVYAVTVQVSRMVGEGLLNVTATSTMTGPGDGASPVTLRPRSRPYEVATTEATTTEVATAEEATASSATVITASAKAPTAPTAPTGSPTTPSGDSGPPQRRRVTSINELLPLRSRITAPVERHRE